MPVVQNGDSCLVFRMIQGSQSLVMQHHCNRFTSESLPHTIEFSGQVGQITAGIRQDQRTNGRGISQRILDT